LRGGLQWPGKVVGECGAGWDHFSGFIIIELVDEYPLLDSLTALPTTLSLGKVLHSTTFVHLPERPGGFSQRNLDDDGDK